MHCDSKWYMVDVMLDRCLLIYSRVNDADKCRQYNVEFQKNLPESADKVYD
jgi:hypothetical protein